MCYVYIDKYVFIYSYIFHLNSNKKSEILCLLFCLTKYIYIYKFTYKKAY